MLKNDMLKNDMLKNNMEDVKEANYYFRVAI
jgi:hypothetical protein